MSVFCLAEWCEQAELWRDHPQLYGARYSSRIFETPEPLPRLET
jgi:hypothetical protein